MNRNAVPVSTGSQGCRLGTLIDGLSRDPGRVGHVVVLSEVTSLMRHVGIAPGEQLFQRATVHWQIVPKDGPRRAVAEG